MDSNMDQNMERNIEKDNILKIIKNKLQKVDEN